MTGRIIDAPAFWVAFLFYAAIVALSAGLVCWMTGGLFIYGLDDAYIHLSLAHNLLSKGVWAVGQGDFNSASSSLIWPVLIAVLAAIFKTEILIPFCLNLASALGLIWLAGKLLPRAGMSERGRSMALSLFVLLVPLPILTFTGMEHLFHAGFILLLCHQAAQIISAQTSSRDGAARLLIFAVIATLARFESLFVVAAVCLLLLLSRRVFLACILGLVSWLPVLVYGMVSRSRGWFFFPNSLELKSNSPFTQPLKETVFTFLSQVVVTPSILLLFVATLIIASQLRRRASDWRRYDIIWAAIFLLTVPQHMLLGSVDGAVYRYEAYLVCIGWIATVRLWAHLRMELGSEARGVLFSPVRIAFCLVLFCGPRIAIATIGVPLAPRGIYEQQYQMAKFFARNYPQQSIAVNDIGLIDYLSTSKVLDLFGLTDITVARLKLKGEFSTTTISALAAEQRVQVAAVYSDWFEGYGGLPQSWEKVGEWTVPFTFVCGGPTVTFYAVAPGAAKNLRDNLKKYESELPGWVTALYY